MSRAAMQQALDALNGWQMATDITKQRNAVMPGILAITALRAELAKPEQLPIAYIKTEDLAELADCNGCSVWAESAPAHADNPGLTAVGLTPVYAPPTKSEQIDAFIAK